MSMFIDTAYLWVIKRRSLIVWSFIVFNCILAVIWYLAYRAIVLSIGSPDWFFLYAKDFGRISLVLYIVTMIPGMVRRFGKFYKPVSILMIFRRYIGITTFMFAFLHYSIERLFWSIKGDMSYVPLAGFQLFGFAAFVILLSFFLTSNDISVKKLGIWWHRVHNLTYIVVWLIFLHVAIQRWSTWTVLIGVASVLQIASHIYARYKVKV